MWPKKAGSSRRSSYDASKWYPIAKMPATVLQILQEDGIYPNLYFGKNMTETVPRDLFRQDWWYRTTFRVGAEHKLQWLVFKGINYRAEIWLNGERLANNRQIVGMYDEYELNVTGKVKVGYDNILAVKVTPEQAFEDIDGVELADAWFDWINVKYFGFKVGDQDIGITYVPDRNAGVWKPVYLRSTDAVEIKNPYVKTDLPLPATSPAALTVYCDLKNGSDIPVSGMLTGEITREGKPSIHIQQEIQLAANEERGAHFSPESVQQLLLRDPDLWWPYQWGPANLYHLKTRVQNCRCRFGFGRHPIRNSPNHPASRFRHPVSRPAWRQFLFKDQRPRFSDPRGRLHPGPALQVRRSQGRGRPALCKGHGIKSAAMGIQDFQRACGGDGRP